jgi:hypothetical protein
MARSIKLLGREIFMVDAQRVDLQMKKRYRALEHRIPVVSSQYASHCAHRTESLCTWSPVRHVLRVL